MYTGYLPDQRLARRAASLQRAMAEHQSVSVAGLSRDWAEQMAFYRLLGNERVREEDLVQALAADCTAAVQALPAEQPHLLLIEDTTQLNFQAHVRRLKPQSGLGVIGDARSTGFFLHPTLVLDAQRQHLLGLCDAMLWMRSATAADKHERAYTHQVLEAKESRRWVESLERSLERLQSTRGLVRLTGVADREADLYPLFARLHERMDLVVRACRDRAIEPSPQRLYPYLSAQPLLGEEEVEIRPEVRKQRSGRRARLQYRSAPVVLRRPWRWTQERPDRLALWAVEVREDPQTVPAGEEPIHWRLVTTHRIESFEQAQQVVTWYRARWYIEQVFRLLKLEGLDVESSELESGQALRRLVLLGLGAALDVLRLLLAERGQSDQPLEQLFGPAEQACLEALARTLEGRSEKQRNPHASLTLAWAAWVIARLGGWKGYRSQRAAGPITYRRGLTRFALLCQGYQLAPP